VTQFIVVIYTSYPDWASHGMVMAPKVF